MKQALAAGGGARWALSFADLCLLLLGFLVLIHAQGARGREVADSIRPALGGRPAVTTRLAANALFEPGEAVLRPAGLAKVAVPVSVAHVDIVSAGVDAGSTRLDAWELAAARTAAVARAIDARGIDPARIAIHFDGAGGEKQMLTVTAR